MDEKLMEKYFDLLCNYIVTRNGDAWLDDGAEKIIKEIYLAGCHARAEADRVAVEWRGYDAKWKRNHPAEVKEIDRRTKLIKKFGITISEYDAILLSQSGVCAICGKNNTSGRRLAVDHDHITGKIRGLLCRGCNVGMGSFFDNPELLIKAASYIQKNSSQAEIKWQLNYR